jgi:hypothetical protein
MGVKGKFSEPDWGFETAENTVGKEAPCFLRPNPTFCNPEWEESDFHVLIVRLSSLRDIQSSTPHLFLAQAARRAIPKAYLDMAFFPEIRRRMLS